LREISQPAFILFQSNVQKMHIAFIKSPLTETLIMIVLLYNGISQEKLRGSAQAGPFLFTSDKFDHCLNNATLTILFHCTQSPQKSFRTYDPQLENYGRKRFTVMIIVVIIRMIFYF